MKQSNRSGKLAVYLFLYIFVVWAALLIAPSLGGGLPEIITNLTAAMEHPFRIQWTDRYLGLAPAGQRHVRSETE